MKKAELVPWGWAGPNWKKNLWITYKLNHEDWQRLWNEQAGCCAGCKEAFAHPYDRQGKLGLKPETEHRHREGDTRYSEKAVRGLLCRNCNDFLGKIQDNMQTLQGLLDYLKKHGDLK